MASEVREPIQVYLTAEERERLERVAASLGVSRSEVLRRGVMALADDPDRGPVAALVDRGLATSPSVRDGSPPPSPPAFAPLEEILAGLDADRDEGSSPAGDGGSAPDGSSESGDSGAG